MSEPNEKIRTALAKEASRLCIRVRWASSSAPMPGCAAPVSMIALAYVMAFFAFFIQRVGVNLSA